MPDTKTRLHIRLKELQKEVDQNKQSFEALQQELLFSEKVLGTWKIINPQQSIPLLIIRRKS